ncbi:uncharacterized protein IL334_001935 [Kwoniella shivajii]|uniref:ARID domain-containing protein n=1 Tax=Kwoniella shivajii TaxID=564305 RepID=A0ABZ1CUH2_9TREE|nr:hypothetical protein IL334_001935 [Kwoniella shivajii]
MSINQVEAERRKYQRRVLEEQLRLLDEEESRNQNSIPIPNHHLPVTNTGSYPPQWAATISNQPSTSNSARHTALSSSIQNVGSSSSTWSTNQRQYQQQHQHAFPHHQQHLQQQQQQPQTSSAAQSYTHRSNTIPSRAAQHQPQSQPQQRAQLHSQQQNQHRSASTSSSKSRPQSFRDLDRSSAGPSSSISPQIPSALPTPQSSNFSSSQPVPLPSEHQLHDWLRDCVGQVNGLDTDWRIHGKKVDMYKLLAAVIRAGGSTEVSSRGWWYMLAKLLNLADDATAQSIKPSIAKQLQELFLQMLGGLEILWDKTKGTEERETLSNNWTKSSSSLPTPVTATMNSGPYSSSHSASSSSNRQDVSSTHRPSHVNPAHLSTKQPTSNRASSANNNQSNTIAAPVIDKDSRQQSSSEIRPHQTIFSSDYSGYSNQGHLNVHANADNHAQPSNQIQGCPTSAASSQSRPSPIVHSQLALHHPTPSHPPHRLPDLLNPNVDRTKGSRHDPSPIQPQPSAKSLSSSQLQPSLVPVSTTPDLQSSRPIPLRILGRSLGEYKVPVLSTFTELVTSNQLPLPQFNGDPQLVKGFWSSDPVIMYSKRCHELGRSVTKIQSGHSSRQISAEELVFWARLLAIMRRNPTVIPPTVEDRPPSIPPPQTTIAPSSIITTGAPGSFTNPQPLIPPPIRERSTATSQGVFDNSVQSASIRENSSTGLSKATKKYKKKAEAEGSGVSFAPKKRGRPLGKPNKPKPKPVGIPSNALAPNALEVISTPQEPTQFQPHSFQPNDGPAVIPDWSRSLPAGSQGPASTEPFSRAFNSIEDQPHSSTQLSPAQVDQASAVVESHSGKRGTFAKRGRPIGSKAKPRKTVADHTDNSLNIGLDGHILVPDSQPENGPSYSQLESLARLAQPSADFENIFQTQHEDFSTLHNNAVDAGPSFSAPPTLSNILSTPLRLENIPNETSGSQPTATGSGKRVKTEAEKAKLAEAAKYRRLKIKEAQGILTPAPKRKSLLKSGPRIPLIPDLSPRKRIDLSTPDKASSAQLRSQDNPATRIFSKRESGLSQDVKASTPNSKGKIKKRKINHPQPEGATASESSNHVSQPGPATLNDVTPLSQVDIGIDPLMMAQDEFEPSPAEVQELARAIAENIVPLDVSDIPITQDGANEMEVRNQADAVRELQDGVAQLAAAESSKARRPNKRKRASAKGKKPSAAVGQTGDVNLVQKIIGEGVSPSVSVAGPTATSSILTPRRKGTLIVELPSSKKVKVQFEPIEVRDESSPEYVPSPEPEEDIESEFEPGLVETENQAEPDFDILIAKPKQTRKRKNAIRLPVDRAKVVIPISKKRRAQLVAKGYYDAFRDDDSEDETLLQRRAHVALRPVKLTAQRGSRSIRPSSPEPIPLRFLLRPGPALLEPFESILTEESLINRIMENPCHWKGCDAILGSEELLRKHIQIRGHVQQGKEEVATTHFSWNTRKTVERQIVEGRWFYRCHWKGCEEPVFKSEADLTQHLTARHVSKYLRCPYEECGLSSLNISHLSRHVMKTHDLPTDQPVPLAFLDSRLPLPKPQKTLPETARTDELTPPVLGTTYKSTYNALRIKDRVAAQCFAGPDPVIHVQHPPHMLQTIDETSLDDNDDDNLLLPGRNGKKRRLHLVVEIPAGRRRKLTEEERRQRILRMLDEAEPSVSGLNEQEDILALHEGQAEGQDETRFPDNEMSPIDEDQHSITSQSNVFLSSSFQYDSAPTPWLETDAMMIEDELVLGAPTPAPFNMFWDNNQDESDYDGDGEENRPIAGPSGSQYDNEENMLPLFGMLNGDEDELEEEEANAELGEENDEEVDEFFLPQQDNIIAQDDNAKELAADAAAQDPLILQPEASEQSTQIAEQGARAAQVKTTSKEANDTIPIYDEANPIQEAQITVGGTMESTPPENVEETVSVVAPLSYTQVEEPLGVSTADITDNHDVSTNQDTPASSSSSGRTPPVRRNTHEIPLPFPVPSPTPLRFSFASQFVSTENIGTNSTTTTTATTMTEITEKYTSLEQAISSSRVPTSPRYETTQIGQEEDVEENEDENIVNLNEVQVEIL